MLEFRRRGVVGDRGEWEAMARSTLGSDGFPMTAPKSYPALVLEADIRDLGWLTDYQNKAWIVLTGQDIWDLIGDRVEHGVINYVPDGRAT